MKQTVITQAVIKKDQHVLLLQKDLLESPEYELPGGIVRPGEDPIHALEESLRQELGHQAQVAQLVETVSEIDQENDLHTIALVYLVGLKGVDQKLTLDRAHKKYVWKKLSDIQPQSISHIARVALQIENAQARTEVDSQQSIASEVANTTNGNAKEVIVYTDGGSRGNPGPSAAGFVILNTNEEVLFEGGKYLGITTNNQAEYQAVKLGLEKAHELGARIVRFRMDSLLIVNQMLGVYQIKNRDLWPIYSSIKELVTKFQKVSFNHVRREFNQEADALVNKVLDEHR